MPFAKLTSKGQITIPTEVRKALKLKAGDKIDFYETEDGGYAFRPKTGSIMDLEGLLHKIGSPSLGYVPTIEEMDRNLLDAVAEDYLRSVSSSSNDAPRKKAS